MRILLLGEYSNLHWTLAEGLRSLGHEVCVVSGGDFWKGYRSDIRIVRKDYGKWGGIRYLLSVFLQLHKFRNYDVVQIINPCFFEVKVSRNLSIYKFLRRFNKKIFLGAYGVDHYWVKTCTQTDTFRYSDFYVNGKKRDIPYTRAEIADWMDCDKEKVNRYIANDCNGIVACLYEYLASYEKEFPEKTAFIPLPVNAEIINEQANEKPDKARFFIGIQRDRSHVKGTDIMEKALDRIAAKYPEKCEVRKAVSVPYEQYQQLLNESDIILDQIYSYTPAMNALLGMAKGMVVVGGGEPENYAILNEDDLRPIINVLPDENDIFNRLEELVLNPEIIPELQRQSIEYVRKHHEAVKVAQAYLSFWERH